MQTAAMGVKRCVSPINILSTGLRAFPRFGLLSVGIDQLDKVDAPLIPDACIYLLRVQVLVSLSDGLTGYTFPLCTPSIEPFREPGPPNPTTLP